MDGKQDSNTGLVEAKGASRREWRHDLGLILAFMAVLWLSLLSRAWVDVDPDFSGRRFLTISLLLAAAAGGLLLLFMRLLRRKSVVVDALTEQVTAAYLSALDKSPFNPAQSKRQTKET